MVISEKTRKILWGRSGNRCAICKCELVKKKLINDSASVVGDECHIISKKSNGPRSNPKDNSHLDGYDNLILLCKVHHKQIDDQPNHFTVDHLKFCKSEHEKWVSATLDENSDKKFNGITLLTRIKTGKELVNIIHNYHFFRFDYDDIKNEYEMGILSDFSQQLQDVGDILDEINIGDVVRTEFDFDQEIKKLEKNRFLVFGERLLKRFNFGNHIDNWIVATIYVVHESNQSIIKLDPTECTPK